MTKNQDLEIVGYGPNGNEYYSVTRNGRTLGWIEFDKKTTKYYFEASLTNAKLLSSNDYRVIAARLDDLNGKGA